MAYDLLIIREFKRYSDLGENAITERLNQIAVKEFELWLNNEMYFSRIRDLYIWRLAQFMENIWNFKTPTAESIAFIFQITLATARAFLKDYKAQYGRKGYNLSLRQTIGFILEEYTKDQEEGAVEVPFNNQTQIDELLETVRRLATDDPTIAAPKKVAGRPYVLMIEKATATRAVRELKGQK